MSEKQWQSKRTWPGGACIGRFRSLRPLQALMTVLWRCKCISASNWFQSLSWAGPFISRPSNCICWTLYIGKRVNLISSSLCILQKEFRRITKYKKLLHKSKLVIKLIGTSQCLSLRFKKDMKLWKKSMSSRENHF